MTSDPAMLRRIVAEGRNHYEALNSTGHYAAEDNLIKWLFGNLATIISALEERTPPAQEIHVSGAKADEHGRIWIAFKWPDELGPIRVSAKYYLSATSPSERTLSPPRRPCIAGPDGREDIT